MILASLGGCATAHGAIVTLGSPLNQTYMPAGFSTPSTAINSSLPHSPLRSPVNGAIVRWRVAGSFGLLALRVLTPNGGATYTGAGTSSAQTALGTGLETFPADLPIRVGQTIGIDIPGPADLGVAVTTGEVGFWQPPLADGASSAAVTEINRELGFNADVQPAPTISAISPASGFYRGGTSVTITGTDLEGASAVSFGTTPATFTVNSESQLTAITPASPATMALPVTVSTVAGTASSPTPFNATACLVPKLKGKKLKATKTKLKSADCKLGKVKKQGGASAKTGKVKSQSPNPGKVLAPGSRVSVKLVG